MNKIKGNLRRIMVACALLALVSITSAFLFFSSKTGLQKNSDSQTKEEIGEVSLKDNILDWFADKSRKKLPVGEYVNWVHDKENGLKLERNMGQYKFSLQYKPSDYMALKETGDFNMSQNILDEKSKNYDDYYFFTFTIADTIGREEILKSNIRQEGDYFRRIEYFSFGMQKDLFLIEGRDTVPCIMYNYERVYGLAPEANFTIGFAKKKKYRHLDHVFVFEDKEFGLGIIKMKLKADQLRYVPSLTMKK